MTRSSTLVWIDAREAVIVHWSDDVVQVERLHSDVPAHHHATGTFDEPGHSPWMATPDRR
jgi:hypothetical protein